MDKNAVIAGGRRVRGLNGNGNKKIIKIKSKIN